MPYYFVKLLQCGVLIQMIVDLHNAALFVNASLMVVAGLPVEFYQKSPSTRIPPEFLLESRRALAGTRSGFLVHKGVARAAPTVAQAGQWAAGQPKLLAC